MGDWTVRYVEDLILERERYKAALDEIFRDPETLYCTHWMIAQAALDGER